MDINVQFIFRKKLQSCTICIDSSDFPGYVFIILSDSHLIYEFGDDVTIKTDGWKVLPKKDDYRELMELRQSIFLAIRTIPQFVAIRQKLYQMNPDKSLAGSYN